jgi:hypothetical protein
MSYLSIQSNSIEKGQSWLFRILFYHLPRGGRIFWHERLLNTSSEIVGHLH